MPRRQLGLYMQVTRDLPSFHQAEEPLTPTLLGLTDFPWDLSEFLMVVTPSSISGSGEALNLGSFSCW